MSRSFPLLLTTAAILVSADAYAARVDVADANLLLGSSTKVASRSWGGAGDPLETSFSEVWFDGTTFTYLYGIVNPGDLDITNPVPFVFGEETRLDFFALQTDLPADTTWGFIARDPQGFGGSTNVFPHSTITCATLSGEIGTYCKSGEARVTFAPFALDGERLRGDLDGANLTLHFFYVLSDQAPTLVPSLAIFSSRWQDEAGPLDEWFVLRSQVDVFAPIPEPGSLLLLGTGLSVAWARNRRRRKA